MAKTETKSDVGSGKELNLRAEIDTSSPFESVKEAVSRFGGVGYWKPSINPFEHKQREVEEISIEKLEEQASQLENDLILKQRETMHILQELESTRAFVEDLKMKLRKEEVSEVGNINTNVVAKENDKENNGHLKGQRLKFAEGFKKAQRNLSRTTNGISEIRASMNVFNMKLERERLSLERTRERLRQNSLKMSSVEERQVAKHSNMDECGTETLKELQILNSEAEKFKKMGEAAKSGILRTISKIERRKAKIRRAEIRLEYCPTAAVSGPKLVGSESTTPVLNPTLSIGQVLSRKLFLQEQLMPSTTAEKGFLKQKASLAQMLGKQNWYTPNCVKVERRQDSDQKQYNKKRKKSGFTARFPLFLAKQNNDDQKREKPTPNLK